MQKEKTLGRKFVIAILKQRYIQPSSKPSDMLQNQQ